MTIGLMKDRFVCIFKMADKHQYSIYDLGPSSVDSVSGKVYLYQGQSLNKTGSWLNDAFASGSSGVITASDATNDYVYLYYVHHEMCFFGINVNLTKCKPQLSFPSMLWISSNDDLTFYGIRNQSAGFTIAKYKFIGSSQLHSATAIQSLTNECSICQSDSQPDQITIKRGKCNKPMTKWIPTHGFTDQRRMYLFAIVDGHQTMVVSFDKSAIGAPIDVSPKVTYTPLSKFFVCAAPPLPLGPSDDPNDSSHTGAFIVIGVVLVVILLLTCGALVICWVCRRQPSANPISTPSKMSLGIPDQSGPSKQFSANMVVIPTPTMCVKMPRQQINGSKSTAKTKAKRSTTKNVNSKTKVKKANGPSSKSKTR